MNIVRTHIGRAHQWRRGGRDAVRLLADMAALCYFGPAAVSVLGLDAARSNVHGMCGNNAARLALRKLR